MYNADQLGDTRESPREPNHNALAIRAAAADMAFSKPLVVNVWRGLVAEAIVRSALGVEWQWCSGDYQAWDFQRHDGIRLEVKQSAARQSWSREGGKSSRATFDIAHRQGRYAEESAWIEGRRRWADLYVFAHHAIIDESADHCDPHQWGFYVIPAGALPMQGSLALSGVRARAPVCYVGQLQSAVDWAANQLAR